MEKPTSPAPVAAPGPADEPCDPMERSQGFMVWPPNHRSSSASSPVVSFATRTAPGAAIRVDSHDAGVERERRLSGRGAIEFAAGVAAGANLAAHPLHAVDQLAVEIAQLGRQLPLTKVILLGRAARPL